jgi:hypothetical protein
MAPGNLENFKNYGIKLSRDKIKFKRKNEIDKFENKLKNLINLIFFRNKIFYLNL